MFRAPSIALLLSLCAATASAQSRVLDLAIGDPARKDEEAPLVLDAVTDTATGEILTPAALARRLSGTSILFVGETHASVDAHRVQLRTLEELLRAGRRVMIGLEMFPYPRQQALDQWSEGLLTEEGFLKIAAWYDSWGFHWGYYRDILLLARDHRLPLVALNAPREVVSAVRSKGFKDLTAEEAAHIPTSIDLRSEDHRTLIRSFFEGGDAAHAMGPDEFEGMYAAQCTWDATMGFHATEALKRHGEPGTILVVLIGSGHVAYGLGIERQARQWLDPERRMASLIPVPVGDDDGSPRRTVRASFANFLWGVPPETDPPYPSLGLSTSAAPGEAVRRVVLIEEGSPAAVAGVAAGDLLVALDGNPIPDRETFNRLVAGMQWGDEVRLTVKRGDETKTLTLLLRRRAEAQPPR